jgi:dihydrofolate synthase / folylpolyglutamate synthase
LAAACRRLMDRDGRPLTMIVGMLGRKDARGFFEPFAPLSARVFTTPFQSAGATSADTLADAARSAGLDARAEGDVETALAQALAAPGPAPHILICGSLHFVGDVLAMSPETWPT